MWSVVGWFSAPRGIWPTAVGWRWAAWAALLGAYGLLVQTEIERSMCPAGVSAETGVVYRRVGKRLLRLDVYRPDTAEAAPRAGWPAVLAIHGGGWTGGSRISFGRMAARLAQHGYVVVSVDYTLSRPGRPSWPAARDDLREALRWIRRHARRYRIDPDCVAALGASAGGHLAASLGTSAGADADERVQAVVDFYGPTDLRLLAREQPVAAGPIAAFLGGAPEDVPERYEAASPVRHVSSHAAPTLIVHGTGDVDVPPDQSVILARALEAAGVPTRLILIPGVRHGFDIRLGSARDLMPEIVAFLARVRESSAGDAADRRDARVKNAPQHSCISPPFLER